MIGGALTDAQAAGEVACLLRGVLPCLRMVRLPWGDCPPAIAVSLRPFVLPGPPVWPEVPVVIPPPALRLTKP